VQLFYVVRITYLVKEVLSICRIRNCEVLVEWRIELKSLVFHSAIHGMVETTNRALSRGMLILVPSLPLITCLRYILLQSNVIDQCIEYNKILTNLSLIMRNYGVKMLNISKNNFSHCGCT
jgi:hypothetical protein